MNSSIGNQNQRESDTFYPLTRDQLRVPGVPVIKIRQNGTTDEHTSSASDSDLQDLEADSTTQTSKNQQPKDQQFEDVANKWENTTWTQNSSDQSDTKQEVALEENSQKISTEIQDTSTGSVPRYFGNQDPDGWSKGDFSSKTTLSQSKSSGKTKPNKKVNSFLDELSRAEFRKPGDALRNSETNQGENRETENRYRSEVPKPHYAKKNSVIFAGGHDKSDEPSAKNFQSIKNRLKAAEDQPENKDKSQLPDVQFGESNPAVDSTEETDTGKKSAPFWAEAGIQVTLGLVLVLSVFSFYSYITNGNTTASSPQPENIQQPDQAQIRIAERN